jgi:hydrophobe/amphiphile efflux-1 (HAE1) family protein
MISRASGLSYNLETMGLSELCVRRPVFAFMLIMFLVVMGVFSFVQLGVDLFPKSDPVQAFVAVSMPGASPEEVVSQAILPLEASIASVSGIDELRGNISEGGGSIQVQFVLDRDINDATNDIREKVSSAMRNLPPNVLPPVVAKSDPDSDPVITLAVSGTRPLRELTEIADKEIKRALETVDNVGGVTLGGGRARQINLMLDLNKLSAYNLTAQDIQSAITTENIEAPGGRIIRGPTETGVRTLGRVGAVSEFGNIIVKNVGGAPIHLRDIGYAEDGMAEQRSFAYHDGKSAVIIEVRRQVGANTVKVVEDIQAKLASIRPTLPSGLNVQVVKEQATYIKNSVEALEEHLLLGSLFASIVVWLFIRNLRAVLIASIAIPTSIITTFAAIRALDMTLNSMTLLGLTLAVGIVIDDAIIVLENIHRHIHEKGSPPMQAAIEATREISLAVVATTISLVIIFVPIAFMTGYARRYLHQFGWTMAVSVLVSMLVAFTLTPALSSRLLRRYSPKKGEEAAKPHGEKHKDTFLDRKYTALLSWSLNHRWVVVVVALLVFSSTFVLNRYIGRDWMPQDDQSELQFGIDLPEGTSLAETERIILEIAHKIEKIPGVLTVIPQSGYGGGTPRVTQANATILLAPEGQRASILEMGNMVRAIGRQYPSARPRVSFPNVLGGRDNGSPIRVQLLGPDIHQSALIAQKMLAEMANEPSVADSRTGLSLSSPEYHVEIDRQLASDLGVRVSDIAGAVRLMMSGEDQISTYKEDSEQYPVTMRLLPGQKDDPSALSRLLVPSARLGLIRLDSIAKIERGLGPSKIDRFSRQFVVQIFANVASGHSLGEASTAVQQIANRVGLPPGYHMVNSGQTKILEETTSNIIMAIALASIFMYMVLAAQFESLTHPFIILLALPMSIPFALVSLILTGRSLNLFSALGVLLLLGIVKKNGILLIDYMNRLRSEGWALREAILEANRVRLRPILMTTFSIVAGLIPTAIGIGAGASQRSAIAITIIGGQLLCLLLTLLVVPTGYSLLEDLKALFSRRPVTAPAQAPAMGD